MQSMGSQTGPTGSIVQMKDLVGKPNPKPQVEIKTGEQYDLPDDEMEAFLKSLEPKSDEE